MNPQRGGVHRFTVLLLGNGGIGVIFGVRAFDALAAMVTVEVRFFPIHIDGNNPELVMTIWVTDFVVDALDLLIHALRTKHTTIGGEIVEWISSGP